MIFTRAFYGWTFASFALWLVGWLINSPAWTPLFYVAWGICAVFAATLLGIDLYFWIREQRAYREAARLMKEMEGEE